MLGVYITQEHVELTARKLHAGGRPSIYALNNVPISCYVREHNQKLRSSVAALADLMVNQNVPWKSIKALVAGLLVALDKNPGVRAEGFR